MNGREKLQDMRKKQSKERERNLALRRAASALHDEDYQKLELMLVEVTNMMEKNLDNLNVGDYNALNGIKNALIQAVGRI